MQLPNVSINKLQLCLQLSKRCICRARQWLPAACGQTQSDQRAACYQQRARPPRPALQSKLRPSLRMPRCRSSRRRCAGCRARIRIQIQMAAGLAAAAGYLLTLAWACATACRQWHGWRRRSRCVCTPRHVRTAANSRIGQEAVEAARKQTHAKVLTLKIDMIWYLAPSFKIGRIMVPCFEYVNCVTISKI